MENNPHYPSTVEIILAEPVMVPIDYQPGSIGGAYQPALTSYLTIPAGTVLKGSIKIGVPV